MKTAAIAIGVVAALVAGYMVIPKETVYLNPEVVEKEVVLEVNPLDEQIKKRNEELEDYYRKVQDNQAQIDVVEAEIKRLQTQLVELKKEKAGFMTQTQ